MTGTGEGGGAGGLGLPRSWNGSKGERWERLYRTGNYIAGATSRRRSLLELVEKRGTATPVHLARSSEEVGLMLEGARRAAGGRDQWRRRRNEQLQLMPAEGLWRGRLRGLRHAHSRGAMGSAGGRRDRALRCERRGGDTLVRLVTDTRRARVALRVGSACRIVAPGTPGAASDGLECLAGVVRRSSDEYFLGVNGCMNYTLGLGARRGDDGQRAPHGGNGVSAAQVGSSGH